MLPLINLSSSLFFLLPFSTSTPSPFPFSFPRGALGREGSFAESRTSLSPFPIITFHKDRRVSEMHGNIFFHPENRKYFDAKLKKALKFPTKSVLPPLTRLRRALATVCLCRRTTFERELGSPLRIVCVYAFIGGAEMLLSPFPTQGRLCKMGGHAAIVRGVRPEEASNPVSSVCGASGWLRRKGGGAVEGAGNFFSVLAEEGKVLRRPLKRLEKGGEEREGGEDAGQALSCATSAR